MNASRPLTILCVTSYEKGQEFLRACKALGCRVLLLTVEKLRNADWPRNSIDEIFFMPEDLPLAALIHAVSYTARFQPIDRVAALDEFDMENVAALREHMRLPGMGLSTVRYFRDKLAMRVNARDTGTLGPQFVHVLNYERIREFMETVPGPWLLKPRSQASGIGMTKIHSPAELWPLLEQLGDAQSYFLLEQFIPGIVFHVDSIVAGRTVLFAEVHAYGVPPLEVSHGGGVFTSRTLARDSSDSLALLEANRRLLHGMGLVRGVTHAEFLKSHADSKFYFVEVAARVGGAYIANVVEAATGVNLWREWAILEVRAGLHPYQLPPVCRDYAGVILSLARQAYPDTSAYNDPEIALRMKKYHHAGLLLKSSHPERVRLLLDSYSQRFRNDFLASAPVPEKPTA